MPPSKLRAEQIEGSEKKSKAGPVAVIGALASLLVAAGSFWSSVAGNAESELLVESIRNAIAPVAARVQENAQDMKDTRERLARLEALLEALEKKSSDGDGVEALLDKPGPVRRPGHGERRPVSAAPKEGDEEDPALVEFTPPPPPAPRPSPKPEAFPKLEDFKAVVQQQGRAWNPAEDAPAGE